VTQFPDLFTRRGLIAAAAASAASPALAAEPTSSHRDATPKSAPQGSFSLFVAGVRAEAQRIGISRLTLDRAFAGVRINRRVIELDHHQPEFTFTWDQYRSRIVSAARVAKGREKYAKYRDLLARVTSRYGVPAGIIVGIWGLESDYGAEMGDFNVIEALATLSWEGRRAAFFRSELMDALRILESGDITPAQMVGSYAGAMGQTQFLPDSFLKYAVDFSGTGRRDIWNDFGCVFASTANYLAREGWQAGLPWGRAVQVPPGFDVSLTGRANRRRVGEWAALGVRPLSAAPMPQDDVLAAVILPAGEGGEAYLVYHPNFLAIRRYNPSDFYCISVGLIGDLVTA
jgi:membrane-bound lytic murein transglycosylase B